MLKLPRLSTPKKRNEWVGAAELNIDTIYLPIIHDTYTHIRPA